MTEVTLGIDIGGTNTVWGLVDKKGNCICKGIVSTQKHQDIENYLDEIFENVEFEKQNLSNAVNISGVGIGAPNGDYYSGNIEDAANLPWKGSIPLCKLVRERLNVPCVITNDANAAAMGEKIFGSAREMNDFIVITLGTGLGGGVFVNGEIVHGHNGFAGEIGHMIVKGNGRDCGCGRKGCLETYVSATGVKRSASKLLSCHIGESELRHVAFNDLSAKMVAEAAYRGDKVASETFAVTGKILGETLANVVTITNPEAIFLMGGLANAGDILFNSVKKHMEENLLFMYKGKVKVLPSDLNEDAAILGAAALTFKI